MNVRTFNILTYVHKNKNLYLANSCPRPGIPERTAECGLRLIYLEQLKYLFLFQNRLTGGNKIDLNYYKHPEFLE